MSKFKFTEITSADRDEVEKILKEYWGTSTIISKDRVRTAKDLKGCLAIRNGMAAGLTTYVIENNELELVTVTSLIKGEGVGTTMVKKVIEKARKIPVSRVWFTTSNDKIQVMDFYQKLGFRFKAVYQNKMTEYRKINPELPKSGKDNIPVLDEIEMEILF